MDWLKVRMAPLGVLAVLACSGDPTDNQGTPTEITAVPDVVFVTQGDSEAVIVSVVDEQGQIIEADFTTSDVPAEITAVEDLSFQELNNTQQIRRQARFFVKSSTLTHTSFKVNALGLTKTIDVTVVPGTLDAAITDTVPKLGDTVTITAAPGTFFNETSVLTFAGNAPVVVSQDETTITFIPFPNITDPAVVSFVGVDANPSVTFTLASPFNVHTDSISDVGADITNLNPGLGEPITLTLPEGLRVVPESLVTLSIANNPVLPINATASPDSTMITFTPPPNSDSSVVVTGVVPSRLAVCCNDAVHTGYVLQLSTTAKVTTPGVDSLPATVNNTAPAGGAEVTLTRTDDSFSFGPTSQVIVGADTALTTGVAGDGSSLTFIPTPGATGLLSATDLDFLGFPLALPTTADAITAGTTVTPQSGTDNPATAPTIPEPSDGATTGFVDGNSYGFDCAAIYGPAAGCQLHKLVLTSDQVIHLKGTWANDADLGFYFLESDGATDTGILCDDNGRVDKEECDLEFVAGTYYLVVVPFGEFYPELDPTPDWVSVRLSSVPAE